MASIKKNPILNPRDKDLSLTEINRARFFLKKIHPTSLWEPEDYKNFHQGFFSLRQAILRIVEHSLRSGLTPERVRFIKVMKNFNDNLSHAPFYFSDPKGAGFQELIRAFKKGGLMDTIEMALELPGIEDGEYTYINATLNALRTQYKMLGRFFAKRIHRKMEDEARDRVMQEYLSRLKLLEVFSMTFMRAGKKCFDLGLQGAKRDCLATLLELIGATLESPVQDPELRMAKQEQERVINNRLKQIPPKKTINSMREDFKRLDGFNVYKHEEIYKIANIISKRNYIRPLHASVKTLAIIDAEKSLLETLKVAWNVYESKGVLFHLKNIVIKMRIHSLSNFVSTEFREQLDKAELKLQVPQSVRSLHYGLLNNNQIWI